VLLLAAGTGERLGAGGPKAFVTLADRPLLDYSLEAIDRSGVAATTVIVVKAEEIDTARRLVSRAGRSGMVTAFVAGGPTRQESVRRGLGAVDPGTEVILCHDAARPFASPALFRRVVEALGRSGPGEAVGAVPVIRTPDTVKRISGDRIVETISREEIGLAQTPQAFSESALREAHERAAARSLEATDDAALLEAAGFRVVAVEGEPWNLKITLGEDLRRAERLLLSGDLPREEVSS
jgi:2-C-methyl-D-erythritol 4-phosphate cytidylyltransferase / 2-C-methyl-D-erythritol 2,4-cyclodiphosphate synthase